MVDRTVQQYHLVEKLGSGGMGDIYKAQDTRLNRFVAMKVLSAGMSSDPERRRRFIQEAQAASALNHPNIITIYDIVTDGDTQYMVMEYVAGKTLLELMPKDGLRVPLVIQYATQMADALSAAHAAGIIHRDLKPANVMVTNSGLVKLLDFGLAKLVDRTFAEDTANTATLLRAPLTMEGTIMGTVNYMSPEQAEGKKLDARSDIFSFGAVLYEMLTGRCAFRGDSTISTLSALLRDEAQPIVQLTPDVPLELDQIVARCLRKDPVQRFQSMQEVQAALGMLKRQSDSGALYNRSIVSAILPPVPVPLPVPPQPRASKTVALVVAAVLVLALGGGGYLWMTQHRSASLPSEGQPPMTATVQSDAKPLTNANVIEMVDAKVMPSVIISQIRSSKTNFNLSSGEVIRLSKAGVPAAVIEAMRSPQTIGGVDKNSPFGSNLPTGTPVIPTPPAPDNAMMATPVDPATAAAPITLGDGLSIRLTLDQDIPSGAQEGDAVQFKVAENVRVNDRVVIAKGAVATGLIVDTAKKKLLGLGGKMTFRLEKVEAVDGQKLTLRVTPTKRRDGSSKRTVDAGSKKSKEVASPAGTEYVGYLDGTKTVTGK